MWARGLEGAPVRVTFDAPARLEGRDAAAPDGRSPDVHRGESALPRRQPDRAQQLHAADVHASIASFASRCITTAPMPTRIASRRRWRRSCAKQRAVFGELPAFEAPYTFIADFLPYAASDAMEHRNSTILTEPASLRSRRRAARRCSAPPRTSSSTAGMSSGSARARWSRSGSTRRIRRASSGSRKGLRATTSRSRCSGPVSGPSMQLASRLGAHARHRDSEPGAEVPQRRGGEPARAVRRPGAWSDPTNFDNTFLSYYTGAPPSASGSICRCATRTDHKVTLDDYMRRLWQDFGRPAPPARAGRAPYTMQDLREVLADVSGDRAFADDFFDRYIQGREVVDYRPLLARAGLVLAKRSPGRLDRSVSLDFSDGTARISRADDRRYAAVCRGPRSRRRAAVVRRRRDHRARPPGGGCAAPAAGDKVRMSIRRRGVAQELTLDIEEDPRLQLVPVETNGQASSRRERAFRNAWLGSKQ